MEGSYIPLIIIFASFAVVVASLGVAIYRTKDKTLIYLYCGGIFIAIILLCGALLGVRW